MPPRGARTTLLNTAPARAVRSSKYSVVFRAGKDKRRGGARLRGVTRILQKKVWSQGFLPARALFGEENKCGRWKGPDGGKRRGSAVDAQVCRLARLSDARRRSSKKFHLVDMIFLALRTQGMEQLMGQRVVCDVSRGLGTAVDLVCSKEDALILVEVKTGYAGDRTASAQMKGRNAKMGVPFASANDTILNRHFAQLTATTAMFVREIETLRRLSEIGLKRVESVLVYATNDDVEVHSLPEWWLKRGERLLSVLE